MENKVNIAEILKHCPPSMKLYSPIFGDVYLNKIRPHLGIVVTTDKEQGNIKEEFLYDGRYGMNGECMLFPSKDKTTWEGFVPPCKFKNGDILYIDCTGDECSYKHNKYIFILKEISDGKIYCYCYIDEVNKYKKFNISWLSDMTYTPRFATEEEKQKLFDSIKENGYKWNEETKTLEKLIKPKFKVGDRIRCKNCVEKYDGFEEGIIDTITDNKYGIVIPHLMGIVTLINITDQDNWELVALKFKTGDRIRRKIKRRNCIDEGEIKSVSFNFYDVFTTDEKSIFIPIREQDEWELVPDKIKPKFKDGDILFVESVYPFIVIYKENENEECFYKYVAIKDYPDCTHIFDGNEPLCHKKGVSKIRFATEEEKKKLFNTIKENGYRWNPETKNLEKLIEPKFKVGDVVQDEDGYKAEITEVNISDECYEYISKIAKGIGSISFEDQDNWELVPNKFDISTLVPFESKVLVRDFEDQIWRPAIWGFYDKSCRNHPYRILGGNLFSMCIPFEGNEHLLGTTKDCEEFYKTW